MSGTCGTCKHWTSDDGWYGTGLTLTPLPGEDHGQRWERQQEAGKLYRLCKGVPFAQDDFAEPPLAFTMDGSGYIADLHTQAEFGCTLHEALPDRRLHLPECIGGPHHEGCCTVARPTP